MLMRGSPQGQLGHKGGRMAGSFTVEREYPDPDALRDWTVDKVDEQPVSARGRCPHCRHECEVPIILSVVTGVRPAGADRLQPVQVLTRQFFCACNQDHQRPAGEFGTGCGRWWLAEIVRDPNGAYQCRPAASDKNLAAAQALAAAVSQQQTAISASAEKWLAGIAALYGLFGLTGIAFGKDALDGLAMSAKVLAGVVLAAGIAMAATAIFCGYRAAYGWPRITSVADDDELQAWKANRDAYAGTAADRLRQAVGFAAAALLALVLGCGIIWFAPPATEASPTVTVTWTDDASTCGTLLPTVGADVIRVRNPSGEVVVHPAADIKSVKVGPCSTG